MSILQKKPVLILSAMLSLVACSRGGLDVKTTPYCNSRYDALTVNPDEIKSKIEIKPGEDFKPGAGDYAYDGSQVYYHDWVRDIKIHLQDAKDPSGQFALNVVCVGGTGINPKTPPLKIAVDMVSDLNVDAIGTLSIRKKTYSMYFGPPRTPGDPWIKKEIIVDPKYYGYASGSPKDTYIDKASSVLQYFIGLKNGALPSINFKLQSFIDDPFVNKSTPNRQHPETVRILVNMKPITPDQRKKIDDDSNKKRNPEKDKRK